MASLLFEAGRVVVCAVIQGNTTCICSLRDLTLAHLYLVLGNTIAEDNRAPTSHKSVMSISNDHWLQSVFLDAHSP